MEKINILSEFRDKTNSDISDEKCIEFQEFMKTNGEFAVINFINAMCIESLSPIDFKNWENVKLNLIRNRKNLKNGNS